MWFAATGFGGGQQAHEPTARCPAVAEPANNQFLRPSAIGRIAFHVPSLA